MTNTKTGALRQITSNLFIPRTRLVRTTKSFKPANLAQRPATHIISAESLRETLCGYRDFVAVGGTANETHICGRCRVKFIKEKV